MTSTDTPPPPHPPPTIHRLVAVGAGILGAVASLLDVDADLVLLVAAHVGVAHEVHRVAVPTHRGRQEVQLDLGLLLQGQALDGQQGVVLGVADHHPPALFTFLEQGAKRKD